MSYSPVAKVIFQQSMYNHDAKQFEALEEDKEIINHMEAQEEVIQKRIQAKKSTQAKLAQEIEQTAPEKIDEHKKVMEFWRIALYCHETLPPLKRDKK